MKLEGKVQLDAIKIPRKHRTTKYKIYVDGLMSLGKGEALTVSLSDEKDLGAAAQRLAVTVRKYAKGVIQGQIRSKLDMKNKCAYLYVDNTSTK